MAIVIPTADNFNRPSAVGGAGVVTRDPNILARAESAAIGTREQASQGVDRANQQFLGTAENEAFALAKQEKDRLDQTKVQDSVNKLRASEADLAYGKDGYLSIKGENLVNRDTPILKDYVERHQQTVTDIGSTLSPDQQRAFNAQANRSAVAFQTDLLRHTMQEHDVYDKQVFNGTNSLEKENAAANWNNPDSLADSRSRIIANYSSAYQKGMLGPDQTVIETKKALSDMHTGVIGQALVNGQTDYAKAYLTKWSKEMDAADMVSMNASILHQEKTVLAATVGTDVVQKASTAINPPDSARAFNIALQTESGGKQTNADGTPVTSSKDAIGIAQVMPTTAPEAAKLAGLPFDENRYKTDPEYNKALGQAYFNKQLQDFGGDVQKAWAAYNAGPGAVESAMKAAAKNDKLAVNDPSLRGKTYLDFLPAETQNYVTKNSAALQAGGGSIAEPTLADIERGVENDPRMKGQPIDVIEAAKSKAKSDFNDMLTARRQTQDNLLTQVMNGVDNGKITSAASLTPEVMQQLGDKRSSAVSYINSKLEQQDKLLHASEAATTQYYALYTDPVALKSKSVGDIMAMAPDMGKSRVDALLQKRAAYLASPQTEHAATVDADQFKQKALQFGFVNKSGTNDAKQLIDIKDRAEQIITAQQDATKKTLSREDKGKILDSLMVPVKVNAVTSMGPFSWNTTMDKRGFEVQAPQNIVIPADTRAQILAAADGHPLSESQIRDVYVKYLAAKGARK